jgi:hypothetical protein
MRWPPVPPKCRSGHQIWQRVIILVAAHTDAIAIEVEDNC